MLGVEIMFQGMEYIYTVYKEKSFSKAAKKLFISQPSLSATVKRIEKKIGAPVFDRSTKPLTLTECGEKYIQYIEHIYSLEHEFSNFVNDWDGLKTGNLILGGSTLFSSWVLPPLMSEFSKRFPLVKIKLIEENTSELSELLRNGKIDFMIDNCILDEEIFSHSHYHTEHLLLAVPKHLDSAKKTTSYQISTDMIRDGSFLDESIESVPLSFFEHDSFILLKPDNDTRKRAIDILQKQNITPHILFELDQQMTSYNITCSGMGISFISDTLIRQVPSHPNVVYYKLDSKLSCRNLFFYWKSGKYFSQAMKEFLKLTSEKLN